MPEVAVCFVDVGQGDCTLAVDKAGRIGLLIDCPAGKYRTVATEMEKQSCEELLAAIITHGHADHAGGVLDLLELVGGFGGDVYVNSDSFLSVPVAGPDRQIAGKRLRAMFNRLREFGERVRPATAGTNGEVGRLRWKLLSPTYPELIGALGLGDPNLASAIVEVRAKGINVLVGSDAPLSTWERVAGDIEMGATLRWPHHGGAVGHEDTTGAHERLFEIVKPSAVIVSVGSANAHHHPSSAFLEARKMTGIPLACTQSTAACDCPGGTAGRCEGTIVVTTDAAGKVVYPQTPQLLTQLP